MVMKWLILLLNLSPYIKTIKYQELTLIHQMIFLSQLTIRKMMIVNFLKLAQNVFNDKKISIQKVIKNGRHYTLPVATFVPIN